MTSGNIIGPAEADSSFSINWVLLRFQDDDLENRFIEATLQNSVEIIRLAVLAGLAIYAGFGLLDWLTIDENLEDVLFIRFVLGCPTFVIILIISYTNYFRVFWQAGLCVVTLAAGLSIVAMTAMVPPPQDENYYVGVIIVIIYSCNMMRLHFPVAVGVSLVLVIAYQLSCLVFSPLPPRMVVNNDFFLIVAAAISCVSNYLQERHLRLIFVSRQVILNDRLRIAALLEKADAANVAKSNFLAVVSHELRTPLNAVIGFSDVLLKESSGPLGAPEYKDYVKDIHKSGQHLLSIINDILCLAKAEAGKLSLAIDDVGASDLVEDALRMCRPQAEQKALTLETSATDPCVVVRGDERLLRQVLINLLSNAVKFTEAGGRVSVRYAPTELGVEFVIQDTGIGIAPEDLPRVVMPFEQAEGAIARSNQGTGLGLPFAKKITEAHGGSFELESAVGVGTTVRVVLPVSDFAAEPSESIAFSDEKERCLNKEDV